MRKGGNMGMGERGRVEKKRIGRRGDREEGRGGYGGRGGIWG